MITLAVLCCFGIVGFFAYMAGAHERHRSAWQEAQSRQVADQLAAAMAPSRSRHPSRPRPEDEDDVVHVTIDPEAFTRGFLPAPRLVVDDEITGARS